MGKDDDGVGGNGDSPNQKRARLIDPRQAAGADLHGYVLDMLEQLAELAEETGDDTLSARLFDVLHTARNPSDRA